MADSKSESLRVELYKDVVSPAAKEVGTITGRAVRAVLAPLRALVWTWEQAEEFVATKVQEKLQNVPEERLITPDPALAGPALQALQFAADPELRDLYAQLLATAMDAKTAMNAHPGFVEILRQLSPDEARLILYLSKHPHVPAVASAIENISNGVTSRSFRRLTLASSNAGCRQPELDMLYIANLERLGIIERLENGVEFADETVYADLLETVIDGEEVDRILKRRWGPEWQGGFSRGGYTLTPWGRQFCVAVLGPGACDAPITYHVESAAD